MGTIAQNELYNILNATIEKNERVAVATIADTKGSTPQSRGAKMIIFEDGRTRGTVGGGWVEAEVYVKAKEALETNQPALHRFDLTSDEASKAGMVCGGTMEIFIEVI